MKKLITVFKGDGIGPEITDCVLEILEAAGAGLAYEMFNVGAAEMEKNGALVSDEAYASLISARFIQSHILVSKYPVSPHFSHS